VQQLADKKHSLVSLLFSLFFLFAGWRFEILGMEGEWLFGVTKYI
jgi:hypothetical protein